MSTVPLAPPFRTLMTIIQLSIYIHVNSKNINGLEMCVNTVRKKNSQGHGILYQKLSTWGRGMVATVPLAPPFRTLMTIIQLSIYIRVTSKNINLLETCANKTRFQRLSTWGRGW